MKPLKVGDHMLLGKQHVMVVSLESYQDPINGPTCKVLFPNGKVGLVLKSALTHPQ